MMKMIQRPAVLSVLLLGSTPSWTQSPPNLVINGNFDTNLSGWNIFDPSSFGLTGTLTITQDPVEDSLGLPNSGAIHLEWDLQDATGTIAAAPFVQSSCLEPTEVNTTYRIGSMHNWLMSPSGGAQISLSSWFGANCASNVASETVPLPFSVLNSWEPSEDTIPSGPLAGGVSMQLDLLLVPDGMGGGTSTGELLVDRILLREDPALLPLQAMATVDNASGLTAFFLGEALDGVSPFPAAYSWDFGDGGISSEQNPVHTYSEEGTYAVTLAVNSGFEEALDTLTVQVDGTNVQVIPTLSGAGLLALGALLLGLALLVLRRRRPVS